MEEVFEGENEFKEWINSIQFIDEKGNIVEPKLTKDESEAEEGDRE